MYQRKASVAMEKWSLSLIAVERGDLQGKCAFHPMNCYTSAFEGAVIQLSLKFFFI